MKGLAIGLVGMMMCFCVQASIVMTGNRIIYPADSREVSVQLTNRGDVPGVVQVWLDDGDAQSVPQTAAAPFVTTPPVFRMAATQGKLCGCVTSANPLHRTGNRYGGLTSFRSRP